MYKTAALPTRDSSLSLLSSQASNLSLVSQASSQSLLEGLPRTSVKRQRSFCTPSPTPSAASSQQASPERRSRASSKTSAQVNILAPLPENPLHSYGMQLSQNNLQLELTDPSIMATAMAQLAQTKTTHPEEYYAEVVNLLIELAQFLNNPHIPLPERQTLTCIPKEFLDAFNRASPIQLTTQNPTPYPPNTQLGGIHDGSYLLSNANTWADGRPCFLGMGGNGIVRAAAVQRNGNWHEEVAVKASELAITDVALKFQLQQLVREADIGQELQFPTHLVTTQKAFLAINEAGETQSYFIMDLVRGTDLFNILNGYCPLPANIAMAYLKPIADAIAYCHSRNIIITDLKLENILQDQLTGLIKLADWGGARKENDHGLGHWQFGTSNARAPELISGHQQHSKASDIFAFGVIACEILAGHPFAAEAPEPLKKEQEHANILMYAGNPRPYLETKLGKGFTTLPENVKGFLLALLHPTPQARPTIFDIEFPL